LEHNRLNKSLNSARNKRCAIDRELHGMSLDISIQCLCWTKIYLL